MKIRLQHFHLRSAFTMIEVAISLAIIGIALVAIVGVLPIGLNTQSDNRESTLINEDATVFMEAVRNGSRGADDLTNYVYLITNTVTKYNNLGQAQNPPDHYSYTYEGSILNGTLMSPPFSITNGLRIVGLLSTPEFTDLSFNPTNNLFSGGYSNHVIAYVRSLSGPAVEKPPQDNQILQQDSFSYHVFCVNAPVASASANSAYADNLQANLHELRLTFLWPLLPNGNLSSSPFLKTYRTLVAGQIAPNIFAGNYLYFYQPQFFTNAP
jgi:prepilin-type N-terminal cleavage/methylation domain-containing protein